MMLSMGLLIYIIEIHFWVFLGFTRILWFRFHLSNQSIYIHVDFVFINTFCCSLLVQYSTFLICNNTICDYRLNQLFKLF